MKNSIKSKKEPSLLHKLIIIYWEQVQQRRHIKQIAHAEWSFDFLCALLVRSGKALGNGIQLEITNKDGQKLTLTYQEAKKSDRLADFDTNIFDQLDNQSAIDKYIREHSTR